MNEYTPTTMRLEAFEVEFSTLTGGTVAVVSLERTQVLAADRREVTHARRIA
jgi:hypothetical protein